MKSARSAPRNGTAVERARASYANDAVVNPTFPLREADRNSIAFKIRPVIYSEISSERVIEARENETSRSPETVDGRECDRLEAKGRFN